MFYQIVDEHKPAFDMKLFVSGYEILHLFSSRSEFNSKFFLVYDSKKLIIRKKLKNKQKIYQALALVFLQSARMEFKATLDLLNTINIKRKDIDINRMIGGPLDSACS